jgi:hypothetical protein
MVVDGVLVNQLVPLLDVDLENPCVNATLDCNYLRQFYGQVGFEAPLPVATIQASPARSKCSLFIGHTTLGVQGVGVSNEERSSWFGEEAAERQRPGRVPVEPPG